jgi:hypothetical protein
LHRWDRSIDRFKFTVAVNQGGLHDPHAALGFSGLRFATAPGFQIPCRVLFSSAAVTWSGRITSCCVDYGENFIIGSVEDGIEAAFHGARAEKLRGDHRAGLLGPLCGRCGFASALVDWFEDEVNGFVETHRARFGDRRFDGAWRDWLRGHMAKFDGIARRPPVAGTGGWRGE